MSRLSEISDSEATLIKILGRLHRLYVVDLRKKWVLLHGGGQSTLYTAQDIQGGLSLICTACHGKEAAVVFVPPPACAVDRQAANCQQF